MSKKSDKAYLISYWKYLKQYRLLLFLGLGLIPLVSFFHLLQPYFMKVVIDTAIPQSNLKQVYSVSAFFLICVLLEFSTKSLQAFIFQYIGLKTVTEIRKDLFNHVLLLSSSYYDKTPVGVLSNRLTSDIESLNDSFSSGLVTLLTDLLTLIGIIVAMYLLSPQLTLVTLCILPFLIIIVNFFRTKLRYFFDLIRSTIGKMNGFIQEQFQGIAVLQLFSQEKNREVYYDEINKSYTHYTVRSVSYDALLYSIVEGLNSILIGVIIFYAWGQYHSQTLTLGVLVAFIDYIQKFFTPLKEVSTKFAVLQQALSALEKIFGIFDIKNSIKYGHTHLEKINGNIRFDSVSFAYKDHEDKAILNKLSFNAKPGELVAIVGPTGSGKSTIMRLLCRLYDGYSGKIYIDDHDILTLDKNTLYQSFSIVNQEIKIFSESVLFNVALNNPAISRDRVEWACKLVHLHETIQSLPHAYDTQLGLGGIVLSQGQAQLLSFARALASTAPILLLDEATAAVDSLTEQKIQVALSALFKEKTSLVIAHRLSTIQHADQILTLHRGEIIERGTHAELLSKKGFYERLYQMQFDKTN
jgi:ATP-binding cassette subfamily B protein